MNSKLIGLCLFIFISFSGRTQSVVELKVNPDKVIGRVDEKIYGQFLEHLYHSVSNGVWGEMVWNRSFEERLLQGDWAVDNNTIAANAMQNKSAWWIFGADNWKNYILEVDARLEAGDGAMTLFAAGGDILKRNKFKIILGQKEQTLEMTSKYRWQDGSRQIEDVAQTARNIEVGKWIQVKVLCQENNLKVWVDGQVIFDYSNPDMPRGGTPGIGAENAKVSFRNFKVTAVSGENLLDELLLPARHWYFKGDGFAKVDTIQAFNEKQALHVITRNGYNTLYQKHFAIKKGDTLKGSLWLKGNAPRLKVRLVKNDRVLAESTLNAISENWKEFPLSLLPNADEPDATLEIVAENPSGFYTDQVSLMSGSALKTGGFRPDLLKAVTDLKPAIIRWPGGSFVEHYDFVNGIDPQHKRVGKLRWDDHDPLSFGIDEFMRFCEKTDAEPLIVLCVGYHNSQSYDTTRVSRDFWFLKAMDEMEYCLGSVETKWGAIRATNGHTEPYQIRFWELDNEVWKMNPDDYVTAIKRFAPAMREKYPGIKIIACGSGAMSKQALPLDTAVITKAAEYVDMISIHYYEELNKYQSGINDWKQYMAGLTKMIQSSANPKMKIFWSEWNLTNTDMRTGLYAGTLLNEMEKDTMIAMATPALWLRHVSATGWNNALINFDQSGYFTAPNYEVMKLWRDHFAPDLIEFQGETGTLNVTATKSDDGKQIILKMVNPTDKGVPISVKVLPEVGDANLQIIASTSLTDGNTMALPDKIRPVSGKVDFGGKALSFSLPTYSASVLSVHLK